MDAKVVSMCLFVEKVNNNLKNQDVERKKVLLFVCPGIPKRGKNGNKIIQQIELFKPIQKFTQK